MDDEADLLRQMDENPGDEAVRAAYADRLAARDPERAEYLRLTARLAHETLRTSERRAVRERVRALRRTLDPAWVARVDLAPVEQCEYRMSFRCPQRWDRLTRTEDESVRFCDVCERPVFYARTLCDARDHADQGRCVALDPQIPRRCRDIVPVHEPVREWNGVLLGELLLH